MAVVVEVEHLEVPQVGGREFGAGGPALGGEAELELARGLDPGEVGLAVLVEVAGGERAAAGWRRVERVGQEGDRERLAEGLGGRLALQLLERDALDSGFQLAQAFAEHRADLEHVLEPGGRHLGGGEVVFLERGLERREGGAGAAAPARAARRPGCRWRWRPCGRRP